MQAAMRLTLTSSNDDCKLAKRRLMPGAMMQSINRPTAHANRQLHMPSSTFVPVLCYISSQCHTLWATARYA